MCSFLYSELSISTHVHDLNTGKTRRRIAKEEEFDSLETETSWFSLAWELRGFRMLPPLMTQFLLEADVWNRRNMASCCSFGAAQMFGRCSLWIVVKPMLLSWMLCFAKVMWRLPSSEIWPYWSPSQWSHLLKYLRAIYQHYFYQAQFPG